ncbi:hypothetical protein [Clostridium perfringens]|uniref:hypothetical protein n=1 Tax=Clostridium perfringens TaxID=1502 RepID=UPI00096A742D|nr:hypothetical protein [Clostridium perfringens]
MESVLNFLNKNKNKFNWSFKISVLILMVLCAITDDKTTIFVCMVLFGSILISVSEDMFKVRK